MITLIVCPSWADEWDDIDDEFDNAPDAGLPQQLVRQLHYNAELGGLFGSGDFLPFFLTTGQHGLLSPGGIDENPNQGYLRAGIGYTLQKRKWKLDAAAEVVAYATTPGQYYGNRIHLQQLYLKGNYGKYTLEVGSREMSGELVDAQLSSGNLVWSGNARPEPTVHLGMDDFVSTVFTRGLLEMKADIAYGHLTDATYNADVYALYAEQYPNTCAADYNKFWDGIHDVRQHNKVEGCNFHRASVFVRSSSQWPVYATFGLEHGVMFGGTVNDADCKEKFNWLKASLGGNGTGQNTFNHAMSYDLRLDARLSGYQLGLYKQHYADDAEGGLFSAGADGLWGAELATPHRWLTKVVVEYLQTTNQGGVVYANDVYTKLGGSHRYTTAGNSNIYHDQHMGAWTHYGMVMGNPMMASPIYNADHYPDMTSNMLRGYHLGLRGTLTKGCGYLLKLQHTDSWGTPFAPFGEIRSNTSALLQLDVNIRNLCDCAAVAAFDRGSLYGDNFGMGIKVTIRR